MNSHQRPEGILSDFVDGQRFRQSPLFSKDPCALQIQLFYDELEVCNPLGSKAKKHTRSVGFEPPYFSASRSNDFPI